MQDQHTAKMRVNVTVGLVMREYGRLKLLQSKGVKVIDVFRAGLDAKEAEVKNG